MKIHILNKCHIPNQRAKNFGTMIPKGHQLRCGLLPNPNG